VEDERQPETAHRDDDLPLATRLALLAGDETTMCFVTCAARIIRRPREE
jgi:hypothetical protein